MQPKPEFLNPDDFPEPHMEPVKMSEAERLALEIDGERYGDVAAELRRLAAEVADWKRIADDLKLVIESDALFLSAAEQEADELRADRDRLAAEVEALRQALLKCKTAALPTEVRDVVNAALRGPAINAARPSALTEEQIVRLYVTLSDACHDAPTPSDMFAIIVRAVERAHGIGKEGGA